VGVGIDLGTSTLSVAIYKDSKLDIIEYNGLLATPSYVAFTDNGVLFGESALSQLTDNPNNTIYGVKRLIGRKFEEIQQEMNNWPFAITKKGGKPVFVIDYKGQTKTLTPEQMLAMQLAELKNAADYAAETSTRKVVIGVPANYTNAQRQATLDAAVLAGFKASLISEPAAAILHYGYEEQIKTNMEVLVFDMGGGTIDLSVITKEFREAPFKVIATAGHTDLGGIDFTNRLVEHFAAEIKRQQLGDLTSDSKAFCLLREACEQAKKDLSSSTTASMTIHSLFDGIDFTMTITREEFDDLCSGLLDEIKQLVDKCLEYDIYARKVKVRQVILVGGSTRIPKIREMLTDFFSMEILEGGSNAVACGAAIEAGMRAGCKELTLLKVDVIPQPIRMK
ncbi:hypothetical protein PFISCL1PPCAC_9271, partial [Pristionchus fissidentatus]